MWIYWCHGLKYWSPLIEVHSVLWHVNLIKPFHLSCVTLYCPWFCNPTARTWTSSIVCSSAYTRSWIIHLSFSLCTKSSLCFGYIHRCLCEEWRHFIKRQKCWAAAPKFLTWNAFHHFVEEYYFKGWLITAEYWKLLIVKLVNFTMIFNLIRHDSIWIRMKHSTSVQMAI